jgi:3'(2'), 5'-bisphosphate nucleotidase
VDFSEESRQARRIAHEAGDKLMALRTDRAAGKELEKEGDRMSQAFIAGELKHAFPDDAVLSEEAADDLARLTADRLWIIDPLDGSREFGELRADWAVHVAFLYRNQLSAGAVALPARDLTLSTLDARLPASPDSGLRIMVSRTRAPAFADDVARQLDAELVPMGSAGYKSMSVVLGEAEAYLHAGGQYEWDVAAPAAVAQAAGLHVSRIDGSPFRFNQANPFLPDLLISRKELAARILRMIADRTKPDQQS